ncbi:hypothetical protein KEJ18_04045 [Candidatus Bathyarchaeota archaeon]|nr:hypothetical protein [Candidatus Bathyarchaeota archaeon]
MGDKARLIVKPKNRRLEIQNELNRKLNRNYIHHGSKLSFVGRLDHVRAKGKVRGKE